MVIYNKRAPGRNFLLVVLLLTSLSASFNLDGQNDPFGYYYRVYFRDKGENTVTAYFPEQLLSDRAIKRREKSGIPLDITDIPVSSRYIQTISQLGLVFHCSSKWMNTALFKTQVPADLNTLAALPFVAEVKLVKSPAPKKYTDKLYVPVISTDDPLSYDRPITMLNGYALHHLGHTGSNVLIAVLDGGFISADKATSLTALQSRNGIKATYDFVKRDPFVYNYHNHGTSVLSVLAGKKEGSIAGTAPDADFILLRTEDTFSESPSEEDFWAAGAEFADSAGADIISSSLGYFNFDNPAMNYKFSDMNGRTAYVTLAAETAASKGIVVFASAGNERNNEWKRIIAPSDGPHVIAAGAVDAFNVIAPFSSAGPSADGRIKPDNTAMGVLIPVQKDQNTIALSSGTSFSCPVLSGMTACLISAVPEALNTEIINVLHLSGDRSNKPDSLYGYGTPDMANALLRLQDNHVVMPAGDVLISPNPSTAGIEVIFRQPPGELILEIFSLSGKIMYKKRWNLLAGRIVRLDNFSQFGQGIYFFRLTTGNGTFVHKVVKLND